MQSHLREYAAAKKSHEEALAIRRKALPKDHPDIAVSLNNLGVVQQDLREYAAAKASYEEALAIYRKALPKDHPDIATSLDHLGDVRQQPRGARHRRSQPSFASPSLTTWGRAGDLREYAAAKKSHEEALAIFRKALPKDHPGIA